MESNNNLQPIEMGSIPNNPNDFMPEFVPPQNPTAPEGASAPKMSESIVNQELTQLFGEEPIKQGETDIKPADTAGISKAELFDRLLSDDSFRKSFIQKYEPSLIKPEDPNSYAIRRLKEDFGENFLSERFTKEDVSTPGTESFIYVRKYNQYVSEAETKQKDTPKDFESLIKDFQASAENEQKELLAQKQKCMQMYNWNEGSFSSFASWASSLTLTDLGYIYSKAVQAKRKVGPAAVPVHMAPGNAGSESPYSDLMSIFGQPVSTY